MQTIRQNDHRDDAGCPAHWLRVGHAYGYACPTDPYTSSPTDPSSAHGHAHAADGYPHRHIGTTNSHACPYTNRHADAPS